jgi:hypothetical protein
VSAFQAVRRGFESHRPLQVYDSSISSLIYALNGSVTPGRLAPFLSRGRGVVISSGS